MRYRGLLLSLLSIAVTTMTLTQHKTAVRKTIPAAKIEDSSGTATRMLMTFIELGSVKCIPCRAMQKVMKAIENKYGDQLRIIFYDVWNDEQAHYAKDYSIRLIPTQVFLDANGKELMRHEGYFPEKDLDAFLQSKGLKPKSTE
jgi:thioredoxin 1